MSPVYRRANMPKLLIAVKNYMEDGGEKCSMAELKAFKDCLTPAEREDFAAQLTEILGVEVEAA
jgi:hypothetical protein